VKRFSLLAIFITAVGTTGATPFVAGAQERVGYPADKSPFRDLETPQRITLFTGYYNAGSDAVGAAPQSAPLIGLRYEVTLGGVAQFFTRAARVSSERQSYNPSLVAGARSLGKVSDPLWLADLGFSFNLTGQRSWHHFVPALGFALGVANATSKAPNDPYRFGTQFSFSTDMMLRYVPSTSYEIRLGLNNTFYQNHYPSAYYTKASDNTSVLTSSTSKSSYMSNTMLTAGLSIPIFR